MVECARNKKTESAREFDLRLSRLRNRERRTDKARRWMPTRATEPISVSACLLLFARETRPQYTNDGRQHFPYFFQTCFRAMPTLSSVQDALRNSRFSL